MHYWKVPRQTLKQAPMRYFMDDDPSLFLKPGQGRKLKLEWGFNKNLCATNMWIKRFEAQWKVFFYYNVLQAMQ
jgi:hypothetical protein